MKRWLTRPENIFVLLALLLSLPACFLFPSGAGYDELAHLARAVEISYGQPIPNRLLAQEALVPLSVNEINYRSRNFYDPLEPGWFARFSGREVGWNITFPKNTLSVYFPTLYMPQAALTWLARRTGIPLLPWYYSLRMAELAGYILLVYLAIRLMPFGKWLMLITALTPTAVLSAVTINTDPYTNASALLFIAWVLHLAVRDGALNLKDTLLTLLATALLFAAKVNAAGLALLLLLLPARKFTSRRLFWIFVLGIAALFTVEVLAWNAYQSLSFRTYRADRGIWMMTRYILADPLGFLRLFFTDIFTNWWKYVRDWTAANPNFLGNAPLMIYPLYLATLVITLLADTAGGRLNRRVRWLLGGAFALSYSFAALFLYLGARGPGDDINMNGRYLGVAMPALLLAVLPNAKPRWLLQLPAALPAALGSFAAGFIFLGSLWLNFHVICGVNRYTGGLCILPHYRNLDPYALRVGPLTPSAPISQEITVQCDQIAELMVWVANPIPAGAQALLEVRTQHGDQLLASASLSGSAANPSDWTAIPIRTVHGMAGQVLRLNLIDQSPAGAEGFSFAVTPTHEYEAGRLWTGDEEQPTDLYFHYGCIVKP